MRNGVQAFKHTALDSRFSLRKTFAINKYRCSSLGGQGICSIPIEGKTPHLSFGKRIWVGNLGVDLAFFLLFSTLFLGLSQELFRVFHDIICLLLLEQERIIISGGNGRVGLDVFIQSAKN